MPEQSSRRPAMPNGVHVRRRRLSPRVRQVPVGRRTLWLAEDDIGVCALAPDEQTLDDLVDHH